MAWEAALHGCLVGRFAVLTEGRVSPTADGRVFFRILDHELQVGIRGRASHERLVTAKGFVVFLRGDVAPGDSAYDSTFRERKLALPIRLDRYVVPENGANIIEVASFVGH